MKTKGITAALGAALILSSCAGGEENVESVTVALTTETAFEQPVETTSQETAFLADYTVQTIETEKTEIETTVSEDEHTVFINGKAYYYYEPVLNLDEFEDSVADCIEELKEFAPKVLAVNALEPTEADSELLMTELPECELTYCFYGNTYQDPDRGFHFYVNPLVEIGAENVWREEQRYICMDFSSFSRDKFTVEELRIYRSNKDEWEPVQFLNGEYAFRLDYAIEDWCKGDPYDGYDIMLGEDDFDYANAETGRYKAIVTTSAGDEREMIFFIDNYLKSEDFLSAEQSEVLSAAVSLRNEYMACSSHIPEEFDAKTKTFEDFWAEYLTPFTYNCALRRGYEASLIDRNGVWNEYIGGDRGGDITYWGSISEPFYSDDEQVIIKETDIYYHTDDPYGISYVERNLRLVNTENGWKVDILQLAF